MNRLEQLFKDLGYNKSNGLFYLKDSAKWLRKFPYRTGRVLNDIIKPYAFFSLCHGDKKIETDHPAPLNNPFILFFNNPDEDIRNEIPKWSFSFGLAPVVFISMDGHLDIYHGYDFEGKDRKCLKNIGAENVKKFSLFFSFENLATGRTWQKLYHRYYEKVRTVDKFLLQNIIDARRILIARNTGNLNPRTANRLIGRSLFIMYLIDRNVEFENDEFIKGDNKEERRESFKKLFSNKKSLYKFFGRIMDKVNGDLFPLTEYDSVRNKIYDEEISVFKKHLEVLCHLFSCSSFFEGGKHYKGYQVQPSLFNLYDFAIIPVELISNIYENFLGESKELEDNIDSLEKISHSRQKEIKAYYTPPFLVDYILSETVAPHLEKQKEASCKVLDPACGSGIFLVETLRKLIEKEMQVKPIKGNGNRIIIEDKRLWQLVRENIFGIDIDSDAIEITTFSICITLLDYKTPKEISSFQFEKLKEINLFGGKNADFFNEEHLFNEKLKSHVKLDFIIGNPPWGKTKDSRYLDYIKERNFREKKETHVELKKLKIGEKEISQAFLVRASDFISPQKIPNCALVVTGKNFYNNSKTTKIWRNYFLSKFNIAQVFELSGVNNKITGGTKVFETAKLPPAIIFYSPAKPREDTSMNLIKHITVRPNRFFNYFRTIVIEKHDFKKVLQKYFMESKGGNDWLWKTFLHGNILDYHFIKRLKNEFSEFSQIMEKYNLKFSGGMRAKDSAVKSDEKKIDTEKYLNWDYLEIDNNRDFEPYSLNPSIKWKTKREELIKDKTIRSEGKVARFPKYFFSGSKLLLKNGLQADHNYGAVSAYSEKNLIFTNSVCSVKIEERTKFSGKAGAILKTMVGIINSKLATYILLSTGASLGIDRSRSVFGEFFSLPVALDKSIGQKAVEIQKKYTELNNRQLPDLKKEVLKSEIDKCKEEIEQAIISSYGISEQERTLIDYAINVSIPVLKREENNRTKSTNIFDPLSFSNKSDKIYLSQYADVFLEHFGAKFNDRNKYFVIDIHATRNFIGFNFRIIRKPKSGKRVSFKDDLSAVEMINKIGNLGLYCLSTDLYVRQDIRGFNKSSFYVIKPNERKAWHKAVAYLDRVEFIDAIVKAEIKHKK